jgi:hypothetical protein
MPYIEQSDRDTLLPIEQAIADNIKNIDNPGKLNYLITVLVHKYINEKGLRYQYINDVVGALEGAKMELYRVVATPYENKKIEENGHVYHIDTP